jgi:hypothetical protein
MKRLHSSYPTIDDTDTINVEIHDSEFSGTAIEVDVKEKVVYQYEGKPLSIQNHIIPTTAELTIRLKTQAQQDVIDDIILSDQNRFFIKVLRGTTLEFLGVITVEQTSIDDVPLDPIGRDYTIAAADGLSTLKDIPYSAAQAPEYISQEQDGKFRVRPSEQNQKATASLEWDPWVNPPTHDYGDYWDGSLKEYQRAGTYDFKASIPLLGSWATWLATSPTSTAIGVAVASGADVTARLYKIDVNDDQINLIDPVVVNFPFRVENTVTDSRHIISLEAKDVELTADDRVKCRLQWSWPAAYLRLTVQDEGYFENNLDATISILNVYDSMLTHLSQILRHLPTYNLYDDADDLLCISTTHVEVSQGATRFEEYIGLSYNALVKDYSSTPPEVLSCYEVLEEFLKLFPGALVYRSGKYYMYSFHSAEDYNVYTKLFAYSAAVTEDWVHATHSCQGRGNYEYLPPIHAAIVSYDRLSSRNLLLGAAGKFPSFLTNSYTTPISVASHTYVLSLSIRVYAGYALFSGLTNLLTYLHRHVFSATVKIGSDYVVITNQNGNLSSQAIYSPATLEATAGVIYVQGSQTSANTSSDLGKEHLIEVSYEIPIDAFTGDLEFSIEYLHTQVRTSSFASQELQSTFLYWTLDDVRLSSIEDREDLLYTEKVSVEVRSGRNSAIIEQKMRYSDLTVVASDPGAIKVWNGTAWVDGATWSGTSLHERIAQWLANTQKSTVSVHRRPYKTDLPGLGWNTPDVDVNMLMIHGSYDTHMKVLNGQWFSYRPVLDITGLNTSTRILSTGKASSNIETASGSTPTAASVGPSNEAVPSSERYAYFTDDETTIYIAIPADMNLPDPSQYTAAEMMLMFSGSLKGSGNMTYRASPTRPEQFSVDLDNQRLVVGRAATTGQEYFIMWEILAS